MGDRYYLSVKCAKCGRIEGDVYYAPTCGFMDATCPACGYVTDLEKYTGITYADASNKDELERIARALSEERPGE
jgi:phage FluMu protein Com